MNATFKTLLLLTIILFITSCRTKDKSPVLKNKNEPIITLVTEAQNLPHVESVAYDYKRDVMYASVQGEQEPGDGYIAVLNNDGILEKTIGIGLNNPKGIAVIHDFIYVSDVIELVKIDINSGEILEKYTLGDEKFLNDVTIDKNSNVYVSDMFSSSIYKLDNNGNYTKWLSSQQLENPNGLLAINNTIYVAAWGLPESKNEQGKTQGRFLKLDITTKEVEKVTTLPLGNLDGIQVYDNENFIVSDWSNGKLYKISKSGDITLFLQSEMSLGDMLFIGDKNMLALPLNRQNKVQLFNIEN